ncbi:MAG: LCP family protein, partial [Raoultibacter sp.]
MTSRNPQPNHSPRSSRAPQSVRAARSARAAQSGRIASRGAAKSFAEQGGPSRSSGNSSGRQSAPQGGAYRAAYTPGDRGGSSYSRQAPASGQYSRNNPSYSKKAKKGMGRGKKIAIGALCTILVLILGAGAAAALYVNNLNNTLSGNKTEEEKLAIQDTLAPTANYTDPFYMMLIGSDAREDDAEMGQRSDTNIVVYVDPTNCIVSMVSIPRDTMIDIDDHGTNKFNAAYNYGVAATIEEANQLCGIKISHFAEVNFDQLITLVDVVGGVEVDVQERIDDPDAGDIVIEEGVQTLNGEAALVFARSRAYADGDFTRTSNQRLLIEALIKKVLSLPIPEIPGVIEQAAKSVSTDLSVSDILGLAMQF